MSLTVELHDANGLSHIERVTGRSYPAVMQTVDVLKADAEDGAMGELGAHPYVAIVHHADGAACLCDAVVIRCNVLKVIMLEVSE